jgi:hypothetical protein
VLGCCLGSCGLGFFLLFAPQNSAKNRSRFAEVAVKTDPSELHQDATDTRNEHEHEHVTAINTINHFPTYFQLTYLLDVSFTTTIS